MGQILIKMDEAMNEMLADLQKERTEKEDWQRKYEDENALALEYKNERNTLQILLDESTTKLAAVEIKYDTQGQALIQLEQKLTEEAESLTECLKEKDANEASLLGQTLLLTECKSSLSTATANLQKFSAEKEASYLEMISACEAKYLDLELEKRDQEAGQSEYK